MAHAMGSFFLYAGDGARRPKGAHGTHTRGVRAGRDLRTCSRRKYEKNLAPHRRRDFRVCAHAQAPKDRAQARRCGFFRTLPHAREKGASRRHVSRRPKRQCRPREGTRRGIGGPGACAPGGHKTRHRASRKMGQECLCATGAPQTGPQPLTCENLAGQMRPRGLGGVVKTRTSGARGQTRRRVP